MSPVTAIVVPIGVLLYRHLCIHVRQVECQPGHANSDRICGIKTEEPHARFSVDRNVCPNIQFWKRGQPGNGRYKSRRHIRHPERHHRNPRLAIESIDFQPLRQQCSDVFFRETPMGKQQIMPAHAHGVGSKGKRPCPICAGAPGVCVVHNVDFQTAPWQLVYLSNDATFK